MGLSVSDKLAFIREYKKQGGKGNYLSAIKQYEEGGETDKVSTSIPYQVPNPWQQPVQQSKPIYQPQPNLSTLQRTDIPRNINTNKIVITLIRYFFKSGKYSI